jgi:hypothetical protein
MVQLNRRTATHGAEEVAAVFAHPDPVRARAEPNRRQAKESARHRYCSGCSRETEHVPWSGGGRPSIPSIQWPAAEPASGATICLDCGQLRAPAASRPGPLAWSSWPRKLRELTAPGNRAPMEAGFALAFDDGASEAAAENEGMPAKPERLSAPVLPRARPPAAVATRLERTRSDRHELLTRMGVLVQPGRRESERRRDSAARVRRS